MERMMKIPDFLCRFLGKSANTGDCTSGMQVEKTEMNILVIDFFSSNRAAAKQTLAEHKVTVCRSYRDGDRLLDTPRYDIAMQKHLERKCTSENMPYHEARKKSLAETELPYWDVVFCDLLMRVGPMEQNAEGQKYVNQKMAVGWSLALRAAKNGARYVAVVTQTDCDSHPASAMLDDLNNHYFTIDGAQVLMTNKFTWVGIDDTERVCEKCGGTGKRTNPYGSQYDCHCDGGNIYAERGKDWGRILKQLVDSEKKG
ncbi:MAG: hypothetical protein QG664_449 [Patescibacteria group bacterium]|nr:hypothetical protein [Patescibacteria group bacterium]